MEILKPDMDTFCQRKWREQILKQNAFFIFLAFSLALCSNLIGKIRYFSMSDGKILVQMDKDFAIRRGKMFVLIDKDFAVRCGKIFNFSYEITT